MKLLLFVFAVAAFVASSMSLKNEICNKTTTKEVGLFVRQLWSYDPVKNECYASNYGYSYKFISYIACMDNCVE